MHFMVRLETSLRRPASATQQVRRIGYAPKTQRPLEIRGAFVICFIVSELCWQVRYRERVEIIRGAERIVQKGVPRTEERTGLAVFLAESLANLQGDIGKVENTGIDFVASLVSDVDGVIGVNKQIVAHPISGGAGGA